MSDISPLTVAARPNAITRQLLTVNRSAGRRLWEGWKRVAKRIGDLQARALLILFYFVILGPFALAVRWGSDPLAIKAGAPKGWQRKDAGNGSPLERATRQF